MFASTFLLASLLSLSLIHQATASFLVGTELDLLKRDNIIQGWALVEDQCPQGTGTCGARSCCPLGSYCDTFDTQYSNICCPTRDGCGYNVTRGAGGNRCAVDSWTLFTTNKDPICCLAGETGTNAAASENYGHCLAAGQSVPSASMATLIGSAGATAPATLPAGYSTTSGPATTSAASSAKSTSTTKTGSTTGSGIASSSVSSAGGTSTKSAQATSVATGATATVTVKSGAGVVGVGSGLLVAVFGCVMAL